MKKNQLRLKKIKKLRKEGFTLLEIGLKIKPHLTAERVRQILNRNKKKMLRCEICRTMYDLEIGCETCLVRTKYYELLQKNIEKNNLKFIEHEIRRLSIHNRSKEIVIQRRLLIEALYYQLGYSVSQISKKLKRDRTSIVNLLNRYSKGRSNKLNQ